MIKIRVMKLISCGDYRPYYNKYYVQFYSYRYSFPEEMNMLSAIRLNGEGLDLLNSFDGFWHGNQFWHCTEEDAEKCAELFKKLFNNIGEVVEIIEKGFA